MWPSSKFSCFYSSNCLKSSVACTRFCKQHCCTNAESIPGAKPTQVLYNQFIIHGDDSQGLSYVTVETLLAILSWIWYIHVSCCCSSNCKEEYPEGEMMGFFIFLNLKCSFVKLLNECLASVLPDAEEGCIFKQCLCPHEFWYFSWAGCSAFGDKLVLPHLCISSLRHAFLHILVLLQLCWWRIMLTAPVFSSCLVSYTLLWDWQWSYCLS